MSDPKIIDIGEKPETNENFNSEYKRLFEPLSSKGWPRWLVYSLAMLGLVYILNPTAGILEILPDNLPIIGNLDEGVAFALITAGILEFFAGKKPKNQ